MKDVFGRQRSKFPLLRGCHWSIKSLRSTAEKFRFVGYEIGSFWIHPWNLEGFDWVQVLDIEKKICEDLLQDKRISWLSINRFWWEKCYSGLQLNT